MARLLHHADHARLCRDFRWQYPARLNMAEQCLAHAADRVAIIDHDGAPHPVTFATLAAMTDALAHALGADRGDRIGIVGVNVAAAWGNRRRRS